MHQMGFAQANATIEKQGIEIDRRHIGDPPRGGIRQFVGFADHECFKLIA